ncbi:hypothetical protein CEXT_202391 [Caerostris extrusa]|uniref:Uncharacterized protein n=1 Tax=Caerostris extrusa TaxID=172846 RepID=A0AAV4R6M3_CAEEX|nr:hypothetical protein CEXT_202391 [Caerostris extrusa]
MTGRKKYLFHPVQQQQRLVTSIIYIFRVDSICVWAKAKRVKTSRQGIKLSRGKLFELFVFDVAASIDGESFINIYRSSCRGSGRGQECEMGPSVFQGPLPSRSLMKLVSLRPFLLAEFRPPIPAGMLDHSLRPIL